MADSETTQAAETAADTTPPAGDQLAATTTEGQQEPTAAELKAELERVRAALKQANNESAGRRKKLEEYETADKKRKDAELSETERLKNELAEVQRAVAERDERLRTMQLRSAVTDAAVKEGFQDANDAWTMIDMAALEIDDKGQVKGAADAVKALAKAKPYLRKPPVGTNVNATNGTGDGKPPPDPKKIEEMAAQRFGVRPPS